MYFLIRQGVRINLKSIFCLMLLQSAYSNIGGLKVAKPKNIPGPHTQALLHVRRQWGSQVVTRLVNKSGPGSI